jgi:hypothetical protein
MIPLEIKEAYSREIRARLHGLLGTTSSTDGLNDVVEHHIEKIHRNVEDALEGQEWVAPKPPLGKI